MYIYIAKNDTRTFQCQTQYLVMSFRSYHSLQTAQKMYSVQDRVCYENQYGSRTELKVLEYVCHRQFFHDHLRVAFFRNISFDNFAFAVMDGHRQRTEND